jgi:hypothetical protein
MRSDIEGFANQDLDHNKLRDFALNYYRVDRPSTEYIRADKNNTNQNNRMSTWYLEQASFFRLKDIQLGYTLPRNLTSSLGLNRARFYVSAINLFTITEYKGRDPEAPSIRSTYLLPVMMEEPILCLKHIHLVFRWIYNSLNENFLISNSYE